MNHIEQAIHQQRRLRDEQCLSRDQYLQAITKREEDLESELVAALEESRLREAE